MSARRHHQRFVLLVASGAVASCGLLGAGSEGAAFPSDGIDDFGDAAPLEVCIGQARVVSPSQAGLGAALCIASGQSARACSEDGACEGIERCVCGRCVVEACTGSSCADGRVCRDNRCTTGCAHDGECDAGERCETGGCARTCDHDTDCHHGERCDPLDGVCAALACSAAIPCGAGDHCEGQQTVFDLREPEIAQVSGKDVAFVQAISTDGTSAIYRARIDEPLRWTADPEAPVLVSRHGEAVGAPAVLADDSRTELYFATGDGSAILRAVSDDGGRTFARDADPVLVPSQAWEQGWIGSPSVVVFAFRKLLAYEGGPRAGIGLVLLGDDGKATPVVDGPIVTPKTIEDPTFFRDVTEVRAPSLSIIEGTLRVYFTARGVEASDAIVAGKAVAAPANDSIALVATRDLVTFDAYPAGPVFSRVTNLRTFLGESEAVVSFPSAEVPGASIVFVSADASGQTSGLARAPSN